MSIEQRKIVSGEQQSKPDVRTAPAEYTPVVALSGWAIQLKPLMNADGH
jgi:hypothetical protein